MSLASSIMGQNLLLCNRHHVTFKITYPSFLNSFSLENKDFLDDYLVNPIDIHYLKWHPAAVSKTQQD